MVRFITIIKYHNIDIAHCSLFILIVQFNMVLIQLDNHLSILKPFYDFYYKSISLSCYIQFV